MVRVYSFYRRFVPNLGWGLPLYFIVGFYLLVCLHAGKQGERSARAVLANPGTQQATLTINGKKTSGYYLLTINSGHYFFFKPNKSETPELLICLQEDVDELTLQPANQPPAQMPAVLTRPAVQEPQPKGVAQP